MTCLAGAFALNSSSRRKFVRSCCKRVSAGTLRASRVASSTTPAWLQAMTRLKALQRGLDIKVEDAAPAA